MVHIQIFGYIPSLLFYLGRYFFSALAFAYPLFVSVIKQWISGNDRIRHHNLRHNRLRNHHIRNRIRQ